MWGFHSKWPNNPNSDGGEPRPNMENPHQLVHEAPKCAYVTES